MQKLRLRYAKRGPARFTSHRDFGRALERALRRAEIPMAYSSGFHPHPRISYANASPTGAASEAEYVEIGLSEVCDPDKVMAALNEVLPTGFEFTAVAEAKRESLTELLQAADWEIVVPGADPELIASAVEQLLALPECTVERMTKNGLRSFDVRAALVSLAVTSEGTVALRSVHQTPLVRPDDVVQALRRLEPGIPETPPVFNRVRQGVLTDTGITDPLR